MGTRSLTHIKDGDIVLTTIYQQYDGYLAGVGRDIAKICEGMKIVNGIPGGSNAVKLANGAGCFAAQLISKLKQDVGGVYIYPANSKDCGEEYTYTISIVVGAPIEIECHRGYLDENMELIFKGTPEELLKLEEKEDN